jgi:hypothetical protein
MMATKAPGSVDRMLAAVRGLHGILEHHAGLALRALGALHDAGAQEEARAIIGRLIRDTPAHLAEVTSRINALAAIVGTVSLAPTETTTRPVESSPVRTLSKPKGATLRLYQGRRS